MSGVDVEQRDFVVLIGERGEKGGGEKGGGGGGRNAMKEIIPPLPSPL